MKKFMHFQETRSANEIQLTDSLAFSLSQLNVNRIIGSQIVKDELNDYFFICLCGVPPIKGEYDWLNAPQKMLIYARGFEPGLSEEDIMNHTEDYDFQRQADRINIILKQITTLKPKIFVYHSFGTFLLSFYFAKYGHSQVSGLVELGPAPLRAYKLTRIIGSLFHNISHQQPRDNLNLLINQFDKQIQSHKNMKLIPFKNRGQKYCFLSYFKSDFVYKIFEYNRHFPSVLKLIIYGEQDILFQTSLLNQRAIYYTYKTAIKNQQILKNQFKTYYPKFNISRIQERFIFCLKGGKHSIHIQKSKRPIIHNALMDYLRLIRGT